MVFQRLHFKYFQFKTEVSFKSALPRKNNFSGAKFRSVFLENPGPLNCTMLKIGTFAETMETCVETLGLIFFQLFHTANCLYLLKYPLRQ